MDELSLSLSRYRWYLLQTKPDQEHIVLAALQRQDVDGIFLQMVGGEHGEVALEHTEPLFPRYLLVRLDLVLMASVVRCIDGVTRLLKMNNEFVSVPDSLVTALRQPCQHGKGITAEQWVAICNGASSLARTQDGVVCGTTRTLQLVELVCQVRRKSLIAAPHLRRVA